MKTLKSPVYTLLSLFILLACVLVFLLATTPGMYTSIKLANFALPGKITIKKPQGRLLDTLSLSELRYKQNDMELVFEKVTARMRLSSFIKGQLNITSFTAEKLHITKHDQQEKVELSLENIALKGTFSKQNLSIHSLKTDYQGLNILLSGELSPQFPYPLTSSLHFKSKKNNPIKINGKITVNGDFNLYQWEGDFQEPSELTLFGSLKNARQLDAVFKWQSLSWPIASNPAYKAGHGRLALNGELNNLNLKLNTKIKAPLKSDLTLVLKKQDQHLSSNAVLHLDQGYLRGEFDMNSLNDPQIKGFIRSNELNLSNYNDAIGKLALQLDFSGPSFEKLKLHSTIQMDYLKNPLSARIDYIDKQLNAKASLGNNVVDIKAEGPYQWQAHAKLSQPELLNEELKGLKTSLAINAHMKNSQEGQMAITLNQGHYQLAEDSPLPILYFNGGTVRFELNKNGLDASGSIAIDPQKTLALSFNLPHFDLKQGLSEKQNMNGEITLNINSLAFLNSISKNIEQAAGQLVINLKTSGSVKNPELTGDVQLSNGELSLPQTGLKLQPIEATLTTSNRNWDLKGLINSNKKALKVEGHGKLSPTLTGQLQINGENVPLVNNSDFKINVSPDLKFIFTENDLMIKGSVTIPEARISPQSFSESSNLSDDVVFVGDESKAKPYNISSNVKVIMGKDVLLDIKGLKGNLMGAAQINQELHGALNASGELSISQGFYKAYGQELTIDQGQLIFTGGLLKNPGINLRAIRRFTNTNQQFSGSNQLFDFNNANLQTINYANNLTVGIEVTGRLNKPKIKLFSNPSNLSQADVLSMLLLGQPAGQASQAGGQLLLTAVSGMNLDNGTGGTQLLSQLKEKLGVDVNMKSSSSYNQQTGTVSESKAFVIGKSLSKRLYVTYNIGLLQTDANVLTIKYLLNKFFSIQVTASDSGNGIDFLYTRQKP